MPQPPHHTRFGNFQPSELPISLPNTGTLITVSHLQTNAIRKTYNIINQISKHGRMERRQGFRGEIQGQQFGKCTEEVNNKKIIY